MFHLVLPTADDIRGARAYLKWGQLDLAAKSKANIATITALERKKTQPSMALLERIATAFMEEGVRFLPDGGFRVDRNIVMIYENRDCFVQIQKDILRTLKGKADGEVLLLGTSDGKANSEIMEKSMEIYDAGITCKSLIADGDDYILGPLEDYRQTNPDNFLSDDVMAVYDHKIAIPVSAEAGRVSKFIVIRHEKMAEQFRKYFYKLWDNGKRPEQTIAKQFLFKKLVFVD